jgi:hypothetical protein
MKTFVIVKEVVVFEGEVGFAHKIPPAQEMGGLPK